MPFFCIKKYFLQIIDLEWSDHNGSFKYKI